MGKRRNPRKRSLFASSRQLRHEALERRELLAAEFGDYLEGPQRGGDPMLIAVAPNNSELLDLDPQDMSANRRLTAPKAMSIFIGGDEPLDETTFTGAFQLKYQREGNFGAPDVENVVIGVIDPNDTGRGLTMRFADNLKDGYYQLSITTQLQDITGASYVPRSPVDLPGGATGDVISFQVETGAKVTAVVPQPEKAGVDKYKTIDVYFDDADLFDTGSTVDTIDFYQLIDTKDTVTTEDDVIHLPDSVTPDPASSRVSLLFKKDLGDFVGDGDSLRLRIGEGDQVMGATAEVFHEMVLAEPGLSAAGAHPVTPGATSGNRWSFVLQQSIVNAGSGFPEMVDNPGGINEPGHRDIELPRESHFWNRNDRDEDNEIPEIAYTFLRDQPYGVNSQGQPVYNEMDADQEARFREILEVYGEVMGVDFVETESDGMQLLVGDLSIAGTGFASGAGVSYGVGAPPVEALGIPAKVVMDSVDFRIPQRNAFGELFFDVAVQEIGHALGLGNAYDLPPGTTNGGGNPPAYPGGGGLYPASTELTFPGPADRIHLNYLDQRESLDVDLYQIEIGQDGVLKAQTFAARLAEASRLDTRLSLFLKDPDTARLELVAANDDFFSSDSYVEIAVSPNPDGSAAEYFVGVSAEGNSLFDPDTGLPSPGGASQGEYELRVDFTADIALTTAITDGSGSVLDGDRDGVAGGNYNFWFEPSIDDAALLSVGNTIYVNKDVAVSGDGTLAMPFSNIPAALNLAESLVATTNPEGVVVKLLPSAGPDGDVATVADNVAYEVGLIASIGQVLEDGRNLELPGGVQLVVDAGVIMKFLDSRISVGSDNDGFDRSQSSISVQGTPDLPVHFTSYNDTSLGSNSNVLAFPAQAGDWGGIEIRNDVDRGQGRIDLERQGLFQNYINHASFQYGGGEVSSIGRVIAPIHLSEARAEISYNTMSQSSDAPISADPNTFELTTFTEPRYQANRMSAAGFKADYGRVGPVVHGNQLIENPTNGLFVRIDTPVGGGLETLRVPARFDDVDVVHVMAENFVLEGVPGGLLQDSQQPDPVVGLITQPAVGLGLSAGDYHYTYTFVDAFGFESPNSEPQLISISANENVQLTDIPVADGKYVGRRLYRSDDLGQTFKLVAELDRTSLDHVDSLVTPEPSAPKLLMPAALTPTEEAGAGQLAPGTYTYKYTFVDESGIESRYSLSRPVTITANKNIELSGIEVASGKYVGRNIYRSDNGGAFRLVAELSGAVTTHTDDNDNPGAIAGETGIRHGRISSTLVVDPGMIVKSQGSRIEIGFGANLLAEGRDGDEIIFTSKTDDRYGASGSFDTDGNGQTRGAEGQWGGFYAQPTSRLSIDEAFIAHAGGVTGVNGGTAHFNPVQVHQAATRITNTRFEDNASGVGPQQGDGRTGYAPQGPAAVYVNSTQPILINNVFVGNAGAAISINTNALGHEWKDDSGRQVGGLGAFEVSPTNNGPVIQGNRLFDNDLNGLQVRAEVLQTAVVWDDTDITHVLDGTVIVPDHHTYGGLRLESSSGEALVVKVLAGGGIEATGRSLDIEDRIGGRVHVIGQPGFPVIMTSINDTSVGSGFTPDGQVQKDTQPGGAAASPGDWQGLSFDPYSNDRNVAVRTEIEGNVGGFGDANATVGVAESVGLLAANEKSGDENLRLGFKIHGAIAADRDVDLFSFEGAAGSMVWIDIDDTDPRLDTILELIDGAGRVLAVSQNSREESDQGELAFVNDDLLRDGHALPMQLDHDAPENADGSYRDLYTTNDGDSGMRVVLPGVTGTRNDFFVRVRSNNFDSNIGGFEMEYTGPVSVSVGEEVVGLVSGAKGVVTKVDTATATFSYVLKTQMQFSNGEDLTSHAGNSVVAVSTLIADGATRGSYELQLRLREMDEFAGSVVRYADLRYATNAIVATGLPAHSPLTGELTHQGGGLDLGSFSNTDRGAVSTAGFLGSINDQDYYGFTIGRDPLATDGTEAVSVSLDIDWADGLTRPDTAIYGLRDNGNGTFSLISRGNDSNVADDITTPIVPGQATTQDDLSRGSQGTRDALVGPMKLPPGRYCIVVAHDGMMDSRFTQFTQFNAPPGVDPADWANTRVLPLGNTETLPLTANSIKTQLGDIPFLIVPPETNGDILVTNPFTGRHDATIDTEERDPYGGVASSERRFQILAIENNQPRTDNSSDSVYSVSTEGLQSEIGQTGIETFTTNGTNNEQQDVGIAWRALSFAGGDDGFLYGLGDRAAFNGGTLDANSAIDGSTPQPAVNNLIYRMDPDTGEALGRNGVTLNGGFESVNPLNPLHPNFNDFGPNDASTPWAGTNVVAQVKAPEEIVSLVGVNNFLYAFGVSGSYYRYAISTDGDLVQMPVTRTAPQWNNNGVPAPLQFASVTRGPVEFNLGDRFFGLEQGTGRMFMFQDNNDAEPFAEFGRQFVDLQDKRDVLGNVVGLGGQTPQDASAVAGMFFGQFQQAWDGGSLVGQTTPSNLGPVTGGIDYDFLGGGHGSVQLDPIDLSGYSADDLPTFYFDYRLHSDDRNVENPDQLQLELIDGLRDNAADSLRVSVAGDDGVWRLVATNNMNDGPAGRVWQTGLAGPAPGAPVEYDPVGSRGYTNVFTQTFVQELFDDSVDRQARIDLGPWAGDDNVQIRIDFTTAGEARPDQTEINLLPGYQIADGHQIVLTGRMPGVDQDAPLAPNVEIFEFDHGLVVDLPAGAAVTEAVFLNAVGLPTVTLAPASLSLPPAPGVVNVEENDSASDVADKVQSVLDGLLSPGQEIHRSSERPSWLQIKGLPDGAASFAGPSLDFSDHILAEQGVTPGSIPVEIEINAENTRQEVAQRVQQAFANTVNFAEIGPRTDSFPLVENQADESIGSLRVYELIVRQSPTVPSHAKSLTMIYGELVDPEPLNPATDYPGEEFGVYTGDPLIAGQRSKGVGGRSSSQNPAPTEKQGMSLGNYQFGLAERGESVQSVVTTGPTIDLVPDPFFEALYSSPAGNVPVVQEVEAGPYQFEIRLGRQTVDANPVLFNERLADGFNLQIDSAGSDIVDGDVFTLSNGYETVTFEFNDVTSNDDGVEPGNVEVPYRRTFSPGQVADAIRNAVNLGEVRDVLQVQATSQGGKLNAPSDPVIFFHGFAAADNLGGVFFESENTAGNYSGPVSEKFEHNAISKAQNLNAGIWNNGSGVPTLTVHGTRGDREVDYYSFNVASPRVTGNFEVDPVGGFNPQMFLLNEEGQVLGLGVNSINQTFDEAGTYYLAVARRDGFNLAGEFGPSPDQPIAYPGGNLLAGPNAEYFLNVALENKSRHFSSIITGQDVGAGFDNGDRNRFRDQGVFIVDSNVVSFSSGDGVTIAAASTASGSKVPAEGSRPKPGPSQHLPLLNADNEIYGAVVENNLLIGNNRGIVLDGDLGMNGPSIHSRLMNNTVFDSNAVGIEIRDGAAPTLLNNVLIENGIGVRGVNPGQTVLRSTVFADNATDVSGNGVTKGTEVIDTVPGAALFVNPDAAGFNLAAGQPNFYPSDGSALIDRSIASQPDRNNLVAIKDVIGIPPSPIVVSDRDLVGQLRENGSTSSGQGQNVNIDIGAIDRSDVTGPLATLMIPGDNDGNGVDIDPANTVLQLESGTFGFFEILISEGSGIGPDESTIDSNRVLLVENRRRLVPGTEVVISYNSANRTLRFQSPAGLWRPDAVYEILLLNEELTLQNGTILNPIADLAGNALQPNRPDGQSRFTIVMPEVGIDFGDAYQTTTFAEYATTREQDGARHAIINTYDPTTLEYHLAEPRLGRYVDDDYYDNKSQSQVLLIDGDDQVVALTIVGNEQDPTSDGPFSITAGVANGAKDVEVVTLPVPGDNISITAAHAFVAGSNVLGQSNLVYEFVVPGEQASANRIAVDIGGTIEQAIGNLATALQAELAARNMQVSVEYTLGSNSMTLLPHDDEDGVPVGTFQSSSPVSPEYLVFGDPVVQDVDDLVTSQITGFLNPLDTAGTALDVTVTGEGYLHAWIDFDDDGVFEAEEKLEFSDPSNAEFNNAAATVETRRLFITNTFSNATPGRRWMRYRFSQDESVLPTGLVVGGETEDYLIDVIPVAVPVPQDDFYEFDEDTTLQFPPAVAITDNDLLIPDESTAPVDVQYLIGDVPIYGTLDLTTNNFLETGNFTYTPNPDFNGFDSFTYRIITQESGLTKGDMDYATVTLSVLPVNDQPDASAAAVTGQEDRPMRITQSDLLATANPDNEDPSPFSIPSGSTLSTRDEGLMNEANQSFVITQVQGNGAPVSAADPASQGANNLTIVEQAGGVEITVVNSAVGDVFSIAYAGTTETFELLDINATEPRDGTVSVFVAPSDDAADIAMKLKTAIETAFDSQTPAMTVGLVGNVVTASFAPQNVNATPEGVTFSATTDQVDVIAGPAIGDTVTLVLGGNSIVFELVAEGDVPVDAGHVGVDLLPFADAASEAARKSAADQLMRAMNVAFLQQGWGVAASIDPSIDATQIVIEPSAITAGRAFETNRGQAIALFDHAGALIEMYYVGNTDLNRDNAPDIGGDAENVDEVSFRATDDGISIDLVNNRFVYGTRKDAPLATAEITILPQNDVPIANDDVIRMDVGDLDPATNLDPNTLWEEFFAGGIVPVPTEDTPLTIPGAFLVDNDLRARASAADENVDPLESDNNDRQLVVASVTANWDPAWGGSVTLDQQSGDVVLVPPTDRFGDISFTYTVEDLGTNELIDGTSEEQSLESLPATVTVAIQPVNDAPVAHDRSLEFTETGDDVQDVFTFTAAQLLDGAGLPETPNTPHGDTTLSFPFNEATQQLRVVEFTTAAGTVGAPASGSGDVVLASDQGGEYTFTFSNSAFVSGTFKASANYNGRSPFNTPETFTYRVSDDGFASASALNPAYPDFDQPDEISDVDQQGIVSITVAETNDAPGFDIPELTIDILERDDELGTVIAGFAENILPGPASAIDETTHQNVSFSVTLDSSVPSDLIQSVTLSPTGDLTVITQPDKVGQATMIVTATDAPKDPNEPFVPRTTVEQIIINVRPVNDGPGLNGSLLGTDSGTTGGPDKAWEVALEDTLGQAPITYTLREDNTQSGGVMQDYTIPMTASVGPGYQQVGLLDVLTVGPENELNDVFAGFPGGAPFDTATEQRLELIDFGTPSELDPNVVLTERGGVLTPVVDQATGLITALQYTPPLDFNASIGGFDSFLYTVEDNKDTGGETYDLGAEALFEDRLTRTNRVYLKMNPVNDRPVFTPETDEVVVLEDSAEFTRPNFAINVLGGPLLTAFDEHSQGLNFTMDLVGRPSFYTDPLLTVNDFFSIAPNIDATTGVLNFKPAADVFGVFEFELQLFDNGLSDLTRGDLNSSDKFDFRIDIRPQNDPPIDQNPVDLDRTILEDSTITWDEAELLAPFVAGPDNETTLTTGGDQTIRLAPKAFPTDSRNGGVVRYVQENGETKLRYTPRADFNGVDEFVYTVIDDGQSVSLDGTVYPERRVATKTVTVTVDPVNDKPRFSGVLDQQNLENDGAVSVPDWATNVMPAAETAQDETVQDLLFVFDLVSGPVDIFETLPNAVIDRVNHTAALNYTLKDDVSGVVVFDVTLVDDGPMDFAIMDEWVSDPPRRLTIAVEGVNNPPSFDQDISTVSVAEDSGPYSQAVFSNVSPGPADESAQTINFEIADLTAEQAAVFVAQPTISSSGVLQFTTAVHQNTVLTGPIVLTVTALDSEGGVSQPVDISIAVSEQNDVPVAIDDTLNDTDEDSIAIIPQAALLDNDVDPDLFTNENEALTVVLSTATSAFGATLDLDPVTGDIVYDPAGSSAIQALQPGQSLTDFFTYQAEDASGSLSGLATVSIRVTGVNDAPIVVNDQVDVDESGSTVIHVLDNDRDVDGTIRVSTVEFGLVPAFGTVTVNAQGVVTYRSFGQLSNSDTFTYSVKDNLGARSNEALVTITNNKPPVAEDDAAFTYIEEPVLVSVLDNDFDEDGFIDEQSVSIRDTPANGAAVIQPGGQVLYTPKPGFSGTDTFQYVVADEAGRESNLATVTVMVHASRLQNTANQFDVNGDGLVTAIDPLLVINFLERAPTIPSPVPPGAVGPAYLDVNGDGLISTSDALLVMNELTRLPGGSGEGEQVPQLAPLAPAKSNLSQIDQDVWGMGVNDLVPNETAKLSNCVPLTKDDVIDLLVSERDSDSDDETLRAVDEVLTDLM